MEKLISGVKEWTGVAPRNEDGSRNEYSLVSSAEVTPAAIELWLTLPEVVKYDPALGHFRRFYENEYNKDEPHKNEASKTTEKRRLGNLNNTINNLDFIESLPCAENVDFIKKGKDIEMPLSSINEVQTPNKISKMVQATFYTKMTLLLACWIFFTLSFIMYNEKDIITRHSFILPGELKEYPLKSRRADLSVLLELNGPFLPEQMKTILNKTESARINSLNVWITRADAKGNKETTKTCTVPIDGSQEADFSIGESITCFFEFENGENSVGNRTEPVSNFININTSSKSPLPFSVSYTEHPMNKTTGVILSLILLVGLYVLIIFEIINRTMAAVVLATTALAVLALAGERPSLPELMSWMDAETLLLLFSMMLLVALMADTGVFDYLAVFTFSVTKGRTWPLITLLCCITATFSTVLDNVTTVLLMTPVTIKLCEVTQLDPVPVLISMVLFSNIGGTSTPVGDPPNVIIASNKIVAASGIHFTNFALHMVPVVFLVMIQAYCQLRYKYRDVNNMRINVSKHIEDLRQQLTTWTVAANSLSHLSKDQHIIRVHLEEKIKKLNDQLSSKVEGSKEVHNEDSFRASLDIMKQKYNIRDISLLVKSSIAITFVVALFFLHSVPELRRISLSWTALLGSILLLILADRDDLEPILNRVEWSTLLFFAALFVLMEALSKLGLIEFIGSCIQYFIMSVGENYRLATALLLILWVSGICSAFVDNVPLMSMMIRVVTALGTDPNVGLPLSPLIWALALGVCLGGNGTLIGASANVVCAGVAEQHGHRITFMAFFKVGFPIMIGHLLVATLYLLSNPAVLEHN